MRFRPVRPNIYLPVIRFGVLVGDWKYILAATLVGYLVPFFFRLKLGIVPLWFVTGIGNAAVSYFNQLLSGAPSFPPNGSNYGFYDSPATNDLIKQALAATDEQTAGDAWAKADKQAMADAAFYPVANLKWSTYHATQVHNAVYLDGLQSFDPANVWLDPAKNGG